MITGKAALAGVMGWPIAHSKSPQLHGTWLERHGIDGAYLPLPVAPEALEQAVAGLKALGFVGWNVTIPHKQAIVPLLDGLTPEAEAIGAVNTVIRQADGRYRGHNTDGYGFMENLRQGQPDFDFTGKTALLLGAGGASRAVVHGLLSAGVARLVIANRSLDRAEALADSFNATFANRAQPPCRAVAWQQGSHEAGSVDLLVNGTSLGMAGKPPLTLDLEALAPSALVTDLVYNPLETDLLAWARARGNPCVDGLGMLLHQARAGFEAWFQTPVQVDQALRDAVLAS